MIVECPSCHAKYKYDAAKLAGAASKKMKCPKCKGVIEVKNENYSEPGSGNRTLTSVPSPSFTTEKQMESEDTGSEQTEGPRTAKVKRETLFGESTGEEIDDQYLKMPENRKLSLAVIQGNNSGEIFQLNKTKMIIGRGGDSDIIVRDGEASRHHARIELMGDRVILRDLDSTNGTYVEEQKISTANLENQTEFRIGTTVFMLIITDLD